MNLVLAGLVLALPGRVLGPLDARLGPGIVHLRGANGAGKTTLLRVACGELRPTGGRVLLDGRSPLVDPTTRARISFLPAVPELSGFLTVEEAWRLMAGLRGRPDWAGAALQDRFGLPGTRPLDRLSVGQRRKAELLAALAGDPDVLLLDEVFAPLDPDSTAVVAHELEARRASRITLLTSHGPLPLAADAALDLSAPY